MITHHSLLITHHSSLVTRHSSLITLHAPTNCQVEFAAGEHVISQGTEGSEFFLIASGAAMVVDERNKTVAVARLQAGQYFGERALLGAEVRHTARACVCTPLGSSEAEMHRNTAVMVN